MVLDQNRIELLGGVSVVCAVGEGWVRGCSESDGTCARGQVGTRRGRNRPPLCLPQP